MKNIDEFIESTSGLQMNNVNFDDLDAEALVVTDENMLDALAKQAAAIAYFGALYKKAKEVYEDLKKQWEIQYGMFYKSAQAYLSKDASSKATIKDIETMTYAKYSNEINEWTQKLQKARDNCDMMEVYYEGWKQKSFVLNNFTQMAIAGLLTPKGAILDRGDVTLNRTQQLLKKMRENASQEKEQNPESDI